MVIFSKENRTWKIIEENRISKDVKDSVGNPLKYKVFYLMGSDGLTVESVGFSREKTETFLVKGNFGILNFQASRWDVLSDKPLDFYTVYLYPPMVKENQKSMAIEMAADIESALLNYPIHPLFNNIPIKVVKFKTALVGNLKTAKDI